MMSIDARWVKTPWQRNAHDFFHLLVQADRGDILNDFSCYER